MDEQQKLMNWILKVAVSVLAAVIGIVVVVMCVGLFLPNEQIDNNKIFEMITPAFNTNLTFAAPSSFALLPKLFYQSPQRHFAGFFWLKLPPNWL